MTQEEIVRSMLVEVGDLIEEAVNVGDRQEAKRLSTRRDSLLTHLAALDADEVIAA